MLVYDCCCDIFVNWWSKQRWAVTESIFRFCSNSQDNCQFRPLCLFALTELTLFLNPLVCLMRRVPKILFPKFGGGQTDFHHNGWQKQSKRPKAIQHITVVYTRAAICRICKRDAGWMETGQHRQFSAIGLSQRKHARCINQTHRNTTQHATSTSAACHVRSQAAFSRCQWDFSSKQRNAPE